MDITNIRKNLTVQRSKLTDKTIRLRSSHIIRNLLNLPAFQTANSIFIYISWEKEVDTLTLIDQLLPEKKIYVPLITDKATCLMTPCRIEHRNELIPKEYGILAPSTPRLELIKEIDATILPGIAFDRSGHRLGWGKGYYDRLLANYNGLKIGLAFDFQVLDHVESAPHDIPLNYLITENEQINCRASLQ